MGSSRTVLSFALSGVILFNAGCANILHNLQPYRLQRLNRGPAPSLDPEFSYQRRTEHKQLAGQVPSSDGATVSGNTATVNVVRAQTPE